MLHINEAAQRIAEEELARERAEAAARITPREKLAELIKNRNARRLEAQHLRAAVAKTSQTLKVAQEKKTEAEARVKAGTDRLANHIIIATKEGRAINTADDPEAFKAQQIAAAAQKEVDAAEAEIKRLEAAGGIIGVQPSDLERQAHELHARIMDLAADIQFSEAVEIMRQALEEHRRLWHITDLISGWEFTQFKDKTTPEFTKLQTLFDRRANVLQTNGGVQAHWEWNRHLMAQAHAGAERWKIYHDRLCQDASATLDPAAA